MAGSARQRKRRRRTRPTKKFWSTRAFLCRNVSSILILLFHPLCALQVDVVPCTTNAHKPWTCIFENSADPLGTLRLTWAGHSNGMKSSPPGSTQLHILLAPRRFRVGPEFAVVRPTLANTSLITGENEFCSKRGVGPGNWRCIAVIGH